MLQIQVSVIRNISRDALNFSPGRVDTKALLAVSSLFLLAFWSGENGIFVFFFQHRWRERRSRDKKTSDHFAQK